MTQLHDLRHGREATSPMQPNDLAVWSDGDYCNIGRVADHGQRYHYHFIEQVTAAQAQAIIDTGGEWCDECQEHLAVEIMAVGDEALALDLYLCPACAEVERALMEQRSANAQAMGIALHGSGPRRARSGQSDYDGTIADFVAMAGQL